jgi:hypothetical protein
VLEKIITELNAGHEMTASQHIKEHVAKINKILDIARLLHDNVKKMRSSSSYRTPTMSIPRKALDQYTPRQSDFIVARDAWIESERTGPCDVISFLLPCFGSSMPSKWMVEEFHATWESKNEKVFIHVSYFLPSHFSSSLINLTGD